jgi:NADP-dependent 3-hydroxy acid dehydrogenase YdfG
MTIAGKIALITGASSGLGAATARAMAAAGAHVLLLARRESKLQEVGASLQGKAASLYAVDLADAAAAAAVAQRIRFEVGTPDIIVNNAGAGQWKFVEETSTEEAIGMMAVPYFAAFSITRAFLPDMLTRNTGHIVNVTSVGARFVWPGATAYLAARWAMRGFNEALRADLIGTGIGVTLCECGVVNTPYWQHNPGSRERVPKVSKLVPELQPDEVAHAIVQAVQRTRRHVVLPLTMRLICRLHAMSPAFVQWLTTRSGFARQLR